MSATNGYYSLIQYCPDLSRLEAANIGVLLFCPEREFLKAHTARDNQRIRHFFGHEGPDWKQINSFKKAIEERLNAERKNIRCLDDLERFISLRANLIQITPPRPMRVRDPEEELRRLFEELVGGAPSHPRPEPPEKRLWQRFVEAELQRKIDRKVRVHVSITDREIEVPFGFQNGRFNLIQPVLFQSEDKMSLLRQASLLAHEGRSLHDTPDPQRGPLELRVIVHSRSSDTRLLGLVFNILKSDDLRPLSEEQVPQLIDEIRRTGRDLPAVTESS